MTHKVARMGLMFFLALLIAVPFPLLAQNQTGKADKTSKADGNDKDSNDGGVFCDAKDDMRHGMCILARFFGGAD